MSTQQQKWSSKSIGSRLQHGIFYLIICTLGRTPAYMLLFFVALWYTIRPLTRAYSAPYLEHRFPEAKGPAKLLHCFRLNWTFGQTLVDRAAVGILRKLDITATSEDEATLQRLCAEGNGLILLSGHVGCWQTSMAGLKNIIDAPVHVVMHRAADDIDRHYFEHTDGPAPFSIIDPRGYLGGTLEMIDALNKGGILCVMGDRLFGNDGNAVEAPFLGETVRLPVSAYRLASATGAPIIVFFSLRTGPGRAVHKIAKVILVPEKLGRSDKNYLSYAREFAAALEELTRNAPYQFFNFYDMWEHKDQS